MLFSKNMPDFRNFHRIILSEHGNKSLQIQEISPVN